MILSLLTAAALIAANAFFVADEFALLAVDRSQVDLKAQQGQRPWRQVKKLVADLSFHLSAAQLGITISSVIFGFVAAPVGHRLLQPILGEDASPALIIAIALTLSNALQIVLGEVVPKTIGIAEPSKVLSAIAPAIAAWGLAVRPVVGVVNDLADSIVSKFGMRPTDELRGVASISELEHVIRTSGEQGTIDPDDVTRLTRTIRFAGKTAGDILTPRVDVTTIGREASLADLCRLSATTGHSRFPVVSTDDDDVRGVVDVKSALGLEPKRRETISVETTMNAVFTVPEARPLDSLLGQLYADHHHLACVVDEHGGIAGIVTIEDIVEEILGEIDDEHDARSAEEIRAHSADRFTVKGGTAPDKIEEVVGLVLPEGDYETVAGFVLSHLQRVPRVGESITWAGWQLVVSEMEQWRVSEIRVIRGSHHRGPAQFSPRRALSPTVGGPTPAQHKVGGSP